MDIKVDENTVVVFDLDDTLYNEVEYLKSAYKSIAQQLSIDTWQHLYAHMFSLYRSGENAFDFLTSTYNTTLKELLKQYREHKPNISPFPGVIDLLRKIKANEGKVAIITDGRSVTQRNKIVSLGIQSLIDFIVISEEVGSEKPNPINFKTVEKQFPKSSYYYIADNIRKDFDAPKKMSWNCVMLIDNGQNIHVGENLLEKIGELSLQTILQIQEINIVS